MSGVMVITELKEGKIKKGSFEAVTAGRKLCGQMGEELSVVIIGDSIESLAGEFGAYGADHVFVLEDSKLSAYSTEGYASALGGLVIISTGITSAPHIRLILSASL